MPIKYQCPKCGRRFVDWGAEKLGFMCPDDEGVELVRVGTGDDASPNPRRSSAKKAPRRVSAGAAVAVDDEDEVEPTAFDGDDGDADDVEDTEGDADSESDAEGETDEAAADDSETVDGDADDVDVDGEAADDDEEE